MPDLASIHRHRSYWAGFFLALGLVLPAYINSSFLGTITEEKWIGLVYTFASLLSILTLTLTPYWFKKYEQRFIFVAIALTFTPLIVLTFVSNPIVIILLFIIYYAAGFMLRYLVDLELETASQNNQTGQIRGIFLTIINFAWLISPILASFLITDDNYRPVYLIAALAILPLIFLLRSNYQLTSQSNISPLNALKLLFNQKKETDISRILVVDFLLNFFYAVMVIYTPIYLHQHIGLNWSELGLVFTIMLLPFVLLDYPLGRLADLVTGEKELLIAGLIITGLATISLSLITTNELALWALVLFVSRIGAASTEVMKETYLFKKVSTSNADIISLARNLAPLSYIAAPIAVSIFLMVWPLQFIFIALGLIMLLGLIPALKLTDTL
ncbi:MAG: MFS transporter [bacterium]|nr:MFS transporter [bacterium]